jgi:hypothetical protein
MAPLETSAAQTTPTKAARAVLDEAMTQGFAASIRTRPDLALLVAVAYLGPTYDTLRVSSLAGGVSPHDDVKHELLRALDGKHQDEALTLCSRAAQADLLAAFAEIVARSIDTKNLGLSALNPFAASLAHRGAALRAGFLSHLDVDAYFAGATKDAAIAAIRACDGETAATEAAKLKKKEAADRAANSAKDASWLPVPLSEWADVRVQTTDGNPASSAVRAPSSDLAQAMVAAIDDDEARARKLAAALDAFLAGPRIAWENAARVSASSLLRAFNAHAEVNLNVNAFAGLLTKRGITRKRFAEGTFYLGLALKEPESLPATTQELAAAAE